MFVRNLLQANDYVTIVPAGIRITLQYNDKGQIESVYVGHNEDKILHPELLTPILKLGHVPNHISITKGTSYVYGCLYTGEVYKVEGLLHASVQTHYISKFIEDPSKFHFFAGHIQSYATATGSPLVVQRWLKTAKFDTLPGYIIPKTLNEGNFSSLLKLDSYPFVYPRIMGYILFRKNEYSFVNTDIRQIVVKKLQKTVTHEGYITAVITGYDSGIISCSYADVVNMNIQVGSVLLVNEDDQIVNCHNFKGQTSEPYSRQITCDYCGKVIQVPTKTGRFTCTDEHCVSVMFSRVTRMLSKFDLAPIDGVRLREFSKSTNNIISLPDILDMEEYQDVVVKIDLPKLLEAVVPASIVTRFADWSLFCNRCNNSVETVLYYLQNPGRILKDLNLDPAIYRRLCQWLETPENLLDITGMFDNPHVEIKTSGKRFEGAPIFRGKSIYITGKFNHGSHEDIRAILSSYAALVYDKFNTAVDCVVVGGLHEEIDGKAIQKAKSFEIPIFEESDFFKKYEIDSDLASFGL